MTKLPHNWLIPGEAYYRPVSKRRLAYAVITFILIISLGFIL